MHDGVKIVITVISRIIIGCKIVFIVVLYICRMYRDKGISTGSLMFMDHPQRMANLMHNRKFTEPTGYTHFLLAADHTDI